MLLHFVQSLLAEDWSMTNRLTGLLPWPSDGGQHRVMLQEGPSVRQKDVVIPIRSVRRVEGVVEVLFSKQRVGDVLYMDLPRTPQAVVMTPSMGTGSAITSAGRYRLGAGSKGSDIHRIRIYRTRPSS